VGGWVRGRLAVQHRARALKGRSAALNCLAKRLKQIASNPRRCCPKACTLTMRRGSRAAETRTSRDASAGSRSTSQCQATCRSCTRAGSQEGGPQRLAKG